MKLNVSIKNNDKCYMYINNTKIYLIFNTNYIDI